VRVLHQGLARPAGDAGGALGASDGLGSGPVRANGAGMIAAGDGVRPGHGDSMAHRPAPATGDVLLVMQYEGKGIVMHPGALRDATAEAATSARRKVATRLSQGEDRQEEDGKAWQPL